MHAFIRFSLVPLAAAALSLGVSPCASAQDTPEQRARERRAVLTVYEDIDGFLRGAVKGYAATHPNAMEGEFIRSSYWREGDTVYAIVKARFRETLPLEPGASIDDEFAALRERYETEENLRVEPAGNGAATVQYERYLFAGNIAGSWEAFDTPSLLSPDSAVQKRALLELELARRQEKYLGKR